MTETTSTEIEIDPRARFREASGRRYATYFCPVLGRLRIQSLTAHERMMLEATKLGEDKRFSAVENAKLFAHLVIATIVGDDNATLFGDGDLDMLSAVDNRYADPLMDAIQKHVGPEPTSEDGINAAKKN